MLLSMVSQRVRHDLAAELSDREKEADTFQSEKEPETALEGK